MNKVITNNIKSIIAGSVIASSLIGLNACSESNKAEDLGNGDTVRESVDENGNAIKNADEVSKEVEGKCGEGKCGEGKCGEVTEDDKTSEGKCGEGKCGEGKCGEE